MILHAPNKEGKSVLHIAAYLSLPQTMEQLVAVPGVNLGLQDSNGCTPLHIAAYYGNVDVGKFIFSEIIF
jgi:ankyrin repeat protein